VGLQLVVADPAMAYAAVAQAWQVWLTELQSVIAKHIGHGLVKLRGFPFGQVQPSGRLQPIGP
jgi:hypothetical protein